MLRYCHQKSIPVFASCFGFQLVIEEFGGKVIPDEEHMEVGHIPIHLTDAAKDDILLKDMPNPFWAIVGHKQRAANLPDGVTLLGYTDDCPYHLIKFSDKPFYASQFHPEMNRDDMYARITRYRDQYLGEDPESINALREALDKIHETTQDSNNLIHHFIDRIVLGDFG